MAASTSTSADVYDVFINHRGPDLKNTFASHLYSRLNVHNLRVFLDRPELRKGENFESQIKGAIASASVHVAIFSPTYAQSKWCLDELHLMLESGSPIIPVFHQVKPADLRWTHEQNEGPYARALYNHKNKRQWDDKPRYDSTTVERWRNALSKAAEISGFELDAFNGDEGALLDKVVECVLKMDKKPELDVAKHPTGLEEKVKDFERTVLPQRNSGRAQVVGIAGMGGVGKTTLAKEIFNRKRSKYSKSYFLSDVRENVSKSSLHALQSKVLTGLVQLNDRIDSVHEGIGVLKKRLSSLQVLLVLDDVDHVDQVDALLPVDVLHRDSFILITSRNTNVLASSGAQELPIYQLSGLNIDHSKELFCSYAFRQPHPQSGFESLVDQFLGAGHGLPLFLKVFGGLLYRRNKSYWEDQWKKLQQTLHKDIQESLQISYNALDDNEKQIFLDIACFFIGENRDMATKIWDGSGWIGSLGFQTLQEMCLVDLDIDNTIKMHDLLRDLGRDLAKHPELPRRLWRGIEDIDGLMQHRSQKTDVRGIKVFIAKDSLDAFFIQKMILNNEYEDKHIDEQDEDEENDEEDDDEEDEDEENDEKKYDRRKKFLKPKLQKLTQLNKVNATNLQLLDVDILSEHILRGLQSPNLIWLRWKECRLPSLPDWIPLKNLRVLEVHGKEMKTLWHDRSQAPKQLRELRIFASLSNIPKSIGELKHLERIEIWGTDFGGHHIEELPEEFCRLLSLKALVLKDQPQLRSLPDSFGNLTNLEHIDLYHCGELERLPDSFRKLTRLKYLDLSCCINLTVSSDTLGNISTLEYINLNRCDNIEVLPSQVAHQRYLKKLKLNLEKLKEFPGDIGELSALEELVIKSSGLETLPPSIGGLSNLKHLELDCFKLKDLPSDIGELSALEKLLIKSYWLETLPPSIGGLSNLKHLVLDCLKLKELPSEIGELSALEELAIKCRPWKYLPDSIRQLNQLSKLTVTNCFWPELPLKKSHEGESEKYCLPRLKHLELKSTKILDKLSFGEGVCPNLQHLLVQFCDGLPVIETLPNALVKLELTGCRQLRKIEGLYGLTKLQELVINNCREVEELPGFETLASLEVLQAHGCMKLKRIRGLAELTKLRRVSVGCCSDLEELRDFEDLRSLKILEAHSCVKLKGILRLAQLTQLQILEVHDCSDLEELQGVENLSSLESLDISGCVKLKSIRGSMELTKLRTLSLARCSHLEGLPGFENVSSLESLHVLECVKLKRIGLAQLTKLRVLCVSGCSVLEELQGLENSSSLESLDISGCVKLKSIPELEQLTRLGTLNVSGRSDIEELQGVENLRRLQELDISRCVKLKSIPGLEQLTRLETLNVSGCSDIEELQGVENLRQLQELDISRCVKLKSIPGLEQLTRLGTLNVSGCSDIEELQGVENLRSLENLGIYGCVKLKSITWLEQLTRFGTLDVSGCSDLEELQGVENLSSLESLDISGCVKLKSIPGLEQLTCLGTLDVSGCSNLEELQGVENLSSLESLDISGCVKLKSIPGLEQLTRLGTLNVSGCSDLEELQGVENLRSLEYLDISGCVKLKSIPGLEQLTRLETLDVSGCSNLEELPDIKKLRNLYLFN